MLTQVIFYPEFFLKIQGHVRLIGNRYFISADLKGSYLVLINFYSKRLSFYRPSSYQENRIKKVILSWNQVL